MSDELGEKILESRRAVAAANEAMDRARRSREWQTAVVVTLIAFCVGIFIGLLRVEYLANRSEAPMLAAMPLAENEYPLESIRVVDADTIDADIMLPLGVTLTGTRIRLSDFDAWESSKRRRSVTVTDEEVVKGKQAAVLLEQLVQDSERSVLLLAEGDRDVYGRVLGRMVVYKDDGSRVFVADFMAEHGMLRIEEDVETGETASEDD